MVTLSLAATVFNPVLPSTNEIIWSLLSFVVLLAVIQKFAYPSIKKTMDARSAQIKNDLEGAEKRRTEAEAILEEYRARLAEAKKESNRIIDEARQTAESLRRDLIARTEAEVEELHRRNAESLAIERARVINEIRTDMAELALDLAEKVIQANIDREANMALIDSYIQKVGA